jgi:MoxR-like ATPase
MRARVSNGRWILEDPTDLPEGTVVEIITRPTMTAPAVATNLYVDAKVRDYVHALFVAARSPKYSAASAGANPSDEAELVENTKACAMRAGRSYVTPEDIKQVAPEMLSRIVVPPYEQRAKGVVPEDVVRAILNDIAVP